MDPGTVIITGGAGYIGSHVALAFLEAGYQVVVLDDLSSGLARLVPAAAQFVRGDVGDATIVSKLILETGASALLHLAGSVVVGESFVDPAKYWRNNTVASTKLFEAALRTRLRLIVYSSTAAVYAPGVGAPIDESGIVGPASPYGRSKLASEAMLKKLAGATGARYAILRYFNVAGADPAGRSGQLSRSSGHLIKAACEVASRKRQTLKVFGTDYGTLDGTCVRDYIHVSDLAETHVHALTYLAAGGESFTANIGNGAGTSVLEVVRALERVTRRPLPLEIGARRPGDPPSVVADTAYVRNLLGWRPRFADIHDILETAWRWELTC